MRSLPQSLDVRRGMRGQQGTALILVIVVLAALTFLGVIGSRSALTELQMTRQDVLSKQALGVAEAGLNHAYRLVVASGGFSNELAGGGTGGTLAGIGSVATLDGASYRFRAFGGGASDGYYVEAQDDFDELTGANDPTVDKNLRIYLVSRGRVGGAERVVTASVSGTSLFPYAIFADRFITMSGGSITDSFDSRTAPYNALTAGNDASVRTGGTNGTGDVTLTGGSTRVNGDATAGVGTVSAPAGGVTGTTTSNGPTMSYPPVPSCWAANGNQYSNSTGITLIGGSTYGGVATGVLNVSGNSQNVILASNRSYCFNTITLQGGGTLTVNGPVTISVTGAVNFSGGSVSNTTALATNLLLYSSMNAPTNQNAIKLSGGSAAYMAVYAPQAGITMSGGTSDFYGAVIGASVTDTGGIGVHYDDALAGIMSAVGQLTGWHEVRN